MKRWVTIMIAVVALVMATPVMAETVENQNSFVAPERGTKFSGPQKVTIQVEAGDLVPGKDTYCEILAYHYESGGLKILDQEFPVTKKGQIITTTLEVSEPGIYSVFTSTKYYVNGFVNYANTRNEYIYCGRTLFAGNQTYFKIEEKSADEDGSADGSALTTGTAASSDKKAVKITAKNKTFKAKVKTKKYAVTLKNKKGKAVKKAKLTLKVNGKTYSAKTNAKGKAIFKITDLKKKGTYKATVKFAGNKTYKAASKKVKIVIKK